VPSLYVEETTLHVEVELMEKHIALVVDNENCKNHGRSEAREEGNFYSKPSRKGRKCRRLANE
jgi:hypothetical protein